MKYANMTNVRVHVLLATALMVLVAALGLYLRPNPVARTGAAFALTEVFPERFGRWRQAPTQAAVVNPQTQEMLDKLYSQVLARTYVNDAGYVIMLSVAYGDDQRGGLQAHMPDVCYPAQGFSLLSTEPGAVSLPNGELPVRKLKTALRSRKEPVTYWFTFAAARDRVAGGHARQNTRRVAHACFIDR
jgi:EpsI family protein